MNEDATLKEQLGSAGTDTETFKAYTLVTDFPDIETLKSSLTPSHTLPKSVTSKKAKSAKEILGAEKSTIGIEASMNISKKGDKDDIITKTEKAFQERRQRLLKRCEKELKTPEPKAARPMTNDKKGITDILKSTVRRLTDVEFRNEVTIENIERQHHYTKTLLKGLQEKVSKLAKSMIEGVTENLNDVRATVEIIVNQLNSTTKVLTQYVNDATLVQIQPQLVEDLKKAEYVTEAVKLLKIEADPLKFNKVRTFKKYMIQMKGEGTSKVK
ncbi:hypothetical protein MMC24_007900 [Lignoscripta atroalba]|nr:hypothetical protein [Lignoscripta atroalba]